MSFQCVTPKKRDLPGALAPSQVTPDVLGWPPDAIDQEVIASKKQRNLFSSSLPETQPFQYSQTSDAKDFLSSEWKKASLFVRDAGDNTITTLYPQRSEDSGRRCVVYPIGRDPTNASLHCPHISVSRHHASIIHDTHDDGFVLQTERNSECWVLQKNTWECVLPNTSVRLALGDCFRVLPNSRHAPRFKVQFALGKFENTDKFLVGSASMDAEYMRLLKSIERDGIEQNNRKGANWTLRELVTLRINLAMPDDDIDDDDDDDGGDNNKDLLPVTTLRQIHVVPGILEAIWYLRGEDHIDFLQRNNQKFWDKQADENGWIGLNYGLLTSYPVAPGHPAINQLEEQVLRPLCDGKSSRNMVCTLCKPGEDTLQQACTSSIQFAVSGNETLDLTVTQRSSDIILGLPHDVIVWSIILHLVRREVRMRTAGQRRLRAGQLNFCISAGGAHVYKVNEANKNELLKRVLIPDVLAHLVVGESVASIGMFELARTYDNDRAQIGSPKLRVVGYGPKSYHDAMKIVQAV